MYEICKTDISRKYRKCSDYLEIWRNLGTRHGFGFYSNTDINQHKTIDLIISELLITKVEDLPEMEQIFRLHV